MNIAIVGGGICGLSLAMNLHRHGISIAISHHPGRRAVASHPETSGIIHNHQIRPAAFNKFRTDAGASTGRNNGLPLRDRVPQALNHFGARVRVTFSSPGVWHSELKLQ